MFVKVKKTRPEAVIPRAMTAGSAGFDLTVVDITEEVNSPFIRYWFGIALEIPPGHVGLIVPRSSVYHTGQMLTNSVGVIDSDYRGEISAVFWKGAEDRLYRVGDRAAQLIIQKTPQVIFVEAEELDTTERGNGGYGSTGR